MLLADAAWAAGSQSLPKADDLDSSTLFHAITATTPSTPLDTLRRKAGQGDAVSQYKLGRAYDFGQYGLKEDKDQALVWYRKAAEQGLAGAQADYGIVLEAQHAASASEIFAWEQRAADQGATIACLLLGVDYELGKGVAVDLQQARRWTERGINSNPIVAWRWLGSWSRYGLMGKSQDSVAAARAYQKAAELGDAESQLLTADFYFEGVGVRKDAEQGRQWAEKSRCAGAAAGVQPPCMVVLQQRPGAARSRQKPGLGQRGVTVGDLNSMGIVAQRKFDGVDLPRDVPGALALLQQAANKKNSGHAAYVLGVDYRGGTHVPMDYAKAMEWLQRAWNNNYPRAGSVIGQMYWQGEGVPRSEQTGLDWTTKAAEAGYSVAQTELGICYLYGRHASKNTAEALKWLSRAEAQNEPWALYYLGRIYLTGNGVARDDARAYGYLSRSAAQGLVPGTSRLGPCCCTGVVPTSTCPVACTFCAKARTPTRSPS